MDSILEKLWRTGDKPFDEKTIISGDNLLVGDATLAIVSALDYLAHQYPKRKLLTFDDWHEHDGFIVSAKSTTIEAILEQVTTPESYIAYHSSETKVYRAIYPESLDFLLRLSLWEADEPNQEPCRRGAHMTFTGSQSDVVVIEERWAECEVQVVESLAYFEQQYSGYQSSISG